MKINLVVILFYISLHQQIKYIKIMDTNLLLILAIALGLTIIIVSFALLIINFFTITAIVIVLLGILGLIYNKK